jgi:RimJ/RimL family protein N-acetyltransferase
MVKLKKFDTSDYGRLINWIDSKELMIQFGGPLFSFPITNNQLDEYVTNEKRLIYKVIDSNTFKVIGHAELNDIDYTNKNARICRILVGDKSSRNKGFGKQIIYAIIKIAFNELKLHRLDLGVYDFNKQAIKCYENCGFEIEGLFKENMKIGNDYWSTYNMSKINTYD